MTIQLNDMTIREQFEASCKSKGVLPCENRLEGWLAAHESRQSMGEEAAWALAEGAESEWVHQAPTTNPNVRDHWLRRGEKVIPLYRARADVAASIDHLKEQIARMDHALKRIEYINHGPDQASGEYRCQEAAAIAKAAREANSPRVAITSGGPTP